MRYKSSSMRSNRKRSDPMGKNKRPSIILKMMLIAIRISSLARISIIGIIPPRRIWRGRIEKKILRSRREMLRGKNPLRSSLLSMTSALKDSS